MGLRRTKLADGGNNTSHGFLFLLGECQDDLASPCCLLELLQPSTAHPAVFLPAVHHLSSVLAVVCRT